MLNHSNNKEIKPSRVILLGANGFIGKSLQKRLNKLDINSVGYSSSQIDLISPECMTLLDKAVSDDDSLVFISALTPDRDKTAATVIKNLKMVEHFCNFAQKRQLQHVIYVSSDAVFGDLEEPISEGSFASPNSFHGYMHLGRELFFQQNLPKNTPLCILRPVGVFGSGDTHNSYGPNQFMKTARENSTISLWGGGEEVRDHIYIDDVVTLVTKAILRKSSGTLNVASGKSYSFEAIANLIKDECGRPIEIINKQRPPNSKIVHRHFDITNLLKSFPDHQMSPLDVALKIYIKEYN